MRVEHSTAEHWAVKQQIMFTPGCLQRATTGLQLTKVRFPRFYTLVCPAYDIS